MWLYRGSLGVRICLQLHPLFNTMTSASIPLVDLSDDNEVTVVTRWDAELRKKGSYKIAVSILSGRKYGAPSLADMRALKDDILRTTDVRLRGGDRLGGDGRGGDRLGGDGRGGDRLDGDGRGGNGRGGDGHGGDGRGDGRGDDRLGGDGHGGDGRGGGRSTSSG